MPKKKIKNENLGKSKIVKKENRAFLGITWQMIHPSNSSENVRWKRNDPEKFIIEDSQKIKLDEWQKMHDKANMTVCTLRTRLRTYFHETRIGKNGYEYSPQREKLYNNEFREGVPFGNGEIFDTGVDKARKRELRAKSTEELMDIILDKEQKIVEQEDELQEMKGNLEEKILVHQAGLESLKDLHQTEINKLKDQVKKCICLNETESRQTQTDPPLDPGPQLPSSTVKPSFSLLDGIEVIIRVLFLVHPFPRRINSIRIRKCSQFACLHISSTEGTGFSSDAFSRPKMTRTKVLPTRERHV